MYSPCRELLDRLMEVAREGQADDTVRVLDVLVNCHSRGDCLREAECGAVLNDAFAEVGMPPPCKIPTSTP